MKQAGRKNGQLSWGKKAPDHGQGLDWDAIRLARSRRLDEEAARGIDNEEVREHLALKQMTAEQQAREQQRKQDAALKKASSQSRISKEAMQRGGRHKGPRFDVEKMKRLYAEGMAPKDIAKEVGCSYDTCIIWLKKEGVFDRDRHRTGGRRQDHRRQKFCGVCGTDLDVPGNSREKVKKMPDGSTRPSGRECIPCGKRRSR